MMKHDTLIKGCSMCAHELPPKWQHPSVWKDDSQKNRVIYMGFFGSMGSCHSGDCNVVPLRPCAPPETAIEFKGF